MRQMRFFENFTWARPAVALTICFAAVCAAIARAGTVEKTPYGTTLAGTSIDQYTLTNANGTEVTIITYGAILTSVQNPSNKMPNIVLGFNNLNDYETKNSPHFGSTIGRYANRIANGTFQLNGVNYCLDANNGPNTLHGGFQGFDTKVWQVSNVIQGPNAAGVQLHYLSPAGDGWTNTAPNPNCPANSVMGFPGNLDTYVTFLLNDQNQIVISYFATTDAPTVVNLTNHAYWNLSGEGSSPVYSHRVLLNSSDFTPVNSNQIPDGTIMAVAGTIFDFQTPKPVSRDLRSDDPQMVYGGGYDFNWVLPSTGSGSQVRFAASVFDPLSNRTLTVFTDQPGIQFYSGNSLDGKLYGASNRQYRQTDGLALETQHYPNSPNQPNFPTTTLLPGQVYRTTTIYQISD